MTLASAAHAAPHKDFVSWRFNDDDTIGTLVLNSREVLCYSGPELSWRRVFKTRALARASFEGDLRAMRKNPCYRWVIA